MIRFSYETPEDVNSPFKHFSLEGDNTRGYVLLGWNDDPTPGAEPEGEGFGNELADMMLQQWFETLGEALDHCNEEFCIMRTDWQAPTVAPPVGKFAASGRGRRKGESTLLNPNPKPLSESQPDS